MENFQWWQELISFAILVPVAWFLLRNQSAQQTAMMNMFKNQLDKDREEIKTWFTTIGDALSKHEKIDKEYLQGINQSIKDHRVESVSQFNKLSMSVGNTTLNEEQAVSMLLSKMWFVSHWKLQFIKQQLVRNHLVQREKSVKSMVKGELERQSQVYLKEFSEYTTPIWSITDWLNKTFTDEDFEEFLERIYEIIFREYPDNLTKEMIIEVKINEVAWLMKHVQNTLATKLRIDLSKFK